MTLTPEALDRYARDYYLSDEVADIDIEERAQRLSAPTVAAHVRDARRVLDMGYGTGEMARELLGRGIAAEVVEGSPLLDCPPPGTRGGPAPLVSPSLLQARASPVNYRSTPLTRAVGQLVCPRAGCWESCWQE